MAEGKDLERRSQRENIYVQKKKNKQIMTNTKHEEKKLRSQCRMGRI